MKQPKKLLDLLNQSFSFDGVREFDSNRVSSLLYDELSNCWALPIVTLTSIAITLPNIESQHVDWLVSSVDEGLHYVRLIDALDEKHYLKGIKSAADVVWLGVELHKKWLDVDLERKATGQVNSAKEIIRALSVEAERIVMEFWCDENPLYWPANVLAANSMYRVSNTILLCYENDECRPEEVFRKLICMIADILAACLTNLSHLIVTKCSCNAIEQREKNVREAAILMTSGLALPTSLILPSSRIPTATAPPRMALPPLDDASAVLVRGPRRGTGKICIGESGSDLGEMGGGDSGSEKGFAGLMRGYHLRLKNNDGEIDDTTRQSPALVAALQAWTTLGGTAEARWTPGDVAASPLLQAAAAIAYPLLLHRRRTCWSRSGFLVKRTALEVVVTARLVRDAARRLV
nr:uncharacterized protein LOC109189816 [Ipomoea trifida]